MLNRDLVVSIAGSLALAGAMIALYVGLGRLGVLDAFAQSWLAWATGQRRLVGYVAYLVALALVLLLPTSSAGIFVLAVLPLFGPSLTFVLSWVAGVVASLVGHRIGLLIGGRLTWRRIAAPLQRARSWVERYPARTWLVAFVSRAVPNPLYDVWSYAFGFSRVSAWRYVSASAVGGAIPLALLCFVPGLLT